MKRIILFKLVIFSGISFFSRLFAALKPRLKRRKTFASRGFQNDRNVIYALYGSVLIPRLSEN